MTEFDGEHNQLKRNNVLEDIRNDNYIEMSCLVHYPNKTMAKQLNSNEVSQDSSVNLVSEESVKDPSDISCTQFSTDSLDCTLIENLDSYFDVPEIDSDMVQDQQAGLRLQNISFGMSGRIMYRNWMPEEPPRVQGYDDYINHFQYRQSAPSNWSSENYNFNRGLIQLEPGGSLGIVNPNINPTRNSNLENGNQCGRPLSLDSLNTTTNEDNIAVSANPDDTTAFENRTTNQDNTSASEENPTEDFEIDGTVVGFDPDYELLEGNGPSDNSHEFRVLQFLHAAAFHRVGPQIRNDFDETENFSQGDSLKINSSFTWIDEEDID